jgi:hypothetical protein
MAKKSVLARDKKREKMIAKYAEVRAEMKAAGDAEGLALLPRNSSPSRRKNRCTETQYQICSPESVMPSQSTRLRLRCRIRI